MDILQRAAHLFDLAQDRMNEATNQAARAISAAAQIRSLETRQAALRQQLDQATVELGRLAFQRWKSPGPTTEGTVEALCLQIEALNLEYQQVLMELNEARAALAPQPSDLPPLPSLPPDIAPGYRDPLDDPFAVLPPVPSAPPAPALPPRPQKAARECPECYATVPGSTDFCPSCGMRVE